MTLRRALGADVHRIYEQIDALLDSEDAIVVLADRHRAICYTREFGSSACHHERLTCTSNAPYAESLGPNQSKWVARR